MNQQENVVIPSDPIQNAKRSLRFGPSRESENGNNGRGYNSPQTYANSGGGGSSGYFGHSGSGSSGSSYASSPTSHYSSGGSSSSAYGSHSSSHSSYGSYGSYGSSPSSSSRNHRPGMSGYGGSYGSAAGTYKYQHEEPMIPLAWVILLIITSVGIGMLITANEFITNSEGNWANFCRLSVSILDCLWKIIYNCYHCRLSEIPNVVWAGEDDDDVEAYTEQELQSMKPRPGIERALDVEHKRSMNRLKKEFGKKKTEMGNKIAKKIGVVERGPGLVALLGERKTYHKVSTTEPTSE